MINYKIYWAQMEKDDIWWAEKGFVEQKKNFKVFRNAKYFERERKCVRSLPRLPKES